MQAELLTADEARLREMFAARRPRPKAPDPAAPPAPAADDALDVLREPAPCDDCLRRARCAGELLACSAFQVYALGRSERHWRAAPRTDATREHFESVFSRRAA